MSENGHNSKQSFPETTTESPGCGHALCRDLKAYVDGELNAPGRWLVRRHLERCRACREEVSGLKRLGEDLTNLENAGPNPRLRARILASLPEAPPRQTLPSARAHRPPSSTVVFGRGMAFGGALTAVALFGAFAALRQPAPPRAAQAASQHETVRPVTSSPVIAPVTKTPPPQMAAHVPVERVYTDPVSREAERLFREEMKAQARAARKRGKTTPGGVNAAKSPADLNTQLAMQVTNVATAREILRQWALQLGGSAAVKSGNTGYETASNRPTTSVPPVPSPNDSKTSAAPAVPPTGNSGEETLVVAMRVPGERAEMLLRSLNQIGTVQSPAPASDIHKLRELAQRRMLLSATREENPAPVTKKRKSDERKAGFVTVSIRLNPAPVNGK